MPRLYLIGGSAGAGKTTTARQLAQELSAGWLQVDTVWLALQDAAPRVSETRRLLAIDERIRQLDGTVEQLVEHQLAAAAFVCGALRRAFLFELQAHETVVADGAWLLPEFIANLELEDTAVSGAIIYEADRAQVQAAMASRREGPRMVAPWHELSATTSWQYGNRMAEEARQHSIPVVAARPRDTLLARVSTALTVHSPLSTQHSALSTN
jgi:2-phosphoglycerate kinase